MTAQPLFDGTFSIDAVASVAHAVVARLHDEAMATIAGLADNWTAPVEEDAPAPAVDEPVTYREPATWSVADDDDLAAEDDEDLPADEEDEEDEDEDDDVRALPALDLSTLLQRPRPAALDVRAAHAAFASAATDEFAVPADGDRQAVAV